MSQQKPGEDPAGNKRGRPRVNRRLEKTRAVEFPVVGIGASAGGLEAVTQLLRHLPGDLGLAVVVVQHLDPAHDSSLVELLSRVCRMTVREATEAMPLEPGHVYVMPPNAGMVLKQGSLHLTPRDEARDPRRPIDLFLRSLAEEMGGRAIGVVLSGTGSDGTLGLETIRAEGGITFAQDRTASYDGMPVSATTAGCVDYVLPPAKIAKELARISSHPTTRQVSAGTSVGHDHDEFDAVVRCLSEVSGVDFSNYKQATLRRRIHRRMVVNRIERVEDYRRLLEQDPEEADGLCRDVLIHVTSFFRDPEVFDALRQSVFPSLLQDRPADRPIRIWVPGCATGEEVYSLAIALLEFLGPRSETTEIKLFGTDISESIINLARSGRYPERIVQDVGRERLRRFFVQDEGGHAICKSVRDLCVFARQDATRDPPFSNLDLISCRNVLIYLGPALQKRILPLFHYALRERGFLLLGTSETVGAVADLFSEFDRQRRIYTRRSVPSRLVFDVGSSQLVPTRNRTPGVPAVVRSVREVDALREADRLLLARCAPPSVLIDESMEILQFRGNTGSFLAPAPGTPSNNLRSMARDGLLPDLTEALEEANARSAPVLKEGLRVELDGRDIDVGIEIVPILSRTSSQRSFLVLFHQVAAADATSSSVPRPADDALATGVERRRIVQLERELAAVKDYLRASVEEREAAGEELRAANEELLSGNEELQSTNEELQTAHEELQATNEELLTVNEELQHRNEQATLLGNDLTNLLASVEIPIIMLGRDLSIRRFTPSAGKLLNLIDSDLGRPILDLKLKLDVPDLEDLLVETLDTLAIEQRDVQDLEGRWHSLSLRPYRSHDGKIDGVVIALTDIDAIKRSEQRLGAARDFAESIVMTVREPLLVLDHELRVKNANDAFRSTFGAVPTALAASGIDDEESRPWRLEALRERLEEARDGGDPFEGLVVETELPRVGHRILRTNARRVHGDDDEKPRILLAIEDVTDERRAEKESAHLVEKLQESERIKSLGVLAGGIAHDFNNILTAILGYAELVQTELTSDSRLRPHVQNIEQGARRAAELCKQMLAYSGRGSLVVKRLNLSSLVRDVASLLRSSVSKKADLRFELDDALPAIVGDVVQIQQIVMNLVINASEALGDAGGAIHVRTGRIRPEGESLKRARLFPEQAREEYIYVEVADDGCGMDAATQAQIFDPFFSLKFTGRGLGLAAVIGIVRGHDGALTLDSETGRGSTFRVLFPAVDGHAEEPEALPPSDLTWRGQGTVLVVDDESSVRGLLTQMLERLGFRVLEAEHGLAGVELFRDEAIEVDLVLLDLTMPYMDGGETYHELRKLRPDARVILMSGYDERQSVDAVTSPGLAGFLRKPFLFRDLVATLRGVFDDAD